ncbi:uncharacterized protein LOC113539691 isoform X2 [Pangasianodon hypophthalmus]|uniref:uncharacterized protein LOC113539691 isoform X2 n=1 Tax=Pangasianodon hypophthalmus TaxID=310915 RepID=UPI002307D7A0|nr:uncharacterized protein LOC113539691 isoform X2 [Pangasianodon hypophthalmus]
MLWQEKETCFMVMVVLMLISSAFCLEIAPQGKSVQFGRLLIGSSKTTNETKDGVVKKVYDEYAGDTNGYQSDQPELTGSQLAKLIFRRWNPSVQCEKDSMTLRIQGRRVPNFLIETSERGPVPLSLMPSHCGFSVKRARRDVALVANYDGCNVAQQGNTYILPLRVLGVAVKMACPVTRPLTTVSCSPSAMVAYLGQSTDAVRLKVNGVWQPVYQASTTCGFTLEVVGGGLTLTAPYTSNCWKFEGAEMLLSVQYMDGEVTLSCSAVQTPATTALPADMQPGTLSDASLTTTDAPATDQQLLYSWLPGMYYPYGMPWYFQYSQPGSPPVTHTTTAPTTPATTVAPASAHQLLYSWLPGMYYPYGMPWYFHYSQPGSPLVTPTTPTTTPATTVAPSHSDQLLLYPWFPGMHNHYVTMASPGVPASGPNSGDKLQMYQRPWVNAFPNYFTLNQKPGSLMVNPSKGVSYPAHFSPLQVKAGPGK